MNDLHICKMPEYSFSFHGMWWCSKPTDKSINVGLFSETKICEYLQKDGQWDLTAFYFESKEDILKLLPENVEYKEIL